MDTLQIPSIPFFVKNGESRKSVPPAYRKWQNHAKSLMEPLTPLMVTDKAHLDIEGPASDHDLNADRLEACCRPFLLFCHWEQSTRVFQDESDLELLDRSKAWFRQALLIGTDPKSDQFFGYSANFHQHSVEMGLLVIALELSRDWLWDDYSTAERAQILAWLESDVGNGHHWNNHMFFGIFVMEFLHREGKGRAAYRGVIDRWFQELEGMYAGDGWYMDGMNQAFDFYNAYAWHYYSLWWVALYGEHDEARCGRLKQRSHRFLQDYPNFFASSGEHPAFGRSIAYRFNATAPFALAHGLEASPVLPEKAQSICIRSLEFFLDKPISQGQGCLSLGWYDEFEPMVEVYSCGGSPYWAAKAFTPLLLDPEDSFFAEETLASDENSTDYALPLPVPSLIVRSVADEVEIINAGSQIASTNTRFGPHKWGRLSYKTSWGFALPRQADTYPLDGGLTAQKVGSTTVYGRHYTAPFAVENQYMGCLYSLGGKLEQFQVSVETHMFWKGEWQLILHRVIAKDAATLRHGSYALSSDVASDLQYSAQNSVARGWNGERGVSIQSLCGFERANIDKQLSPKDGDRCHIQAPFHVTGLLEAELSANEPTWLCCLHWAGRNEEEGAEWVLDSAEKGNWQLSHSLLGNWQIQNDALPQL